MGERRAERTEGIVNGINLIVSVLLHAATHRILMAWAELLVRSLQ